MPTAKALQSVFNSPNLRQRRGRTLATGAAAALVLALLLFAVPAPLWTRAEGVLWVPDEAQVRAGTDGFVDSLVAPADGQVAAGQPLARLQDPFLSTRVAVLEAQRAELDAQYQALAFSDRVQAAVVAEELATVDANLLRSRQREADLLVRSPGAGRWVVPQSADLPGRYLAKGQLIGYVVRPQDFTARVVLLQDDIARVRARTRSVEVVLPGWSTQPLAARITREVPGGSSQLPTAALGSSGGGMLAVDPRDTHGTTTLGRIFQLELSLPQAAYMPYLGARVQVRFDLGHQPVGLQVYDAVRRLLLRQFDV